MARFHFEGKQWRTKISFTGNCKITNPVQQDFYTKTFQKVDNVDKTLLNGKFFQVLVTTNSPKNLILLFSASSSPKLNHS